MTVLFGTYLDRYGPATVKDATWWSGLSRTDVLTALAMIRRPIVRIKTPWADDAALMFTDRFEEFLAGPHARTGVNLLAHEDTALKAYFQTRARYLGTVPHGHAFNRIGEALPTVLLDGQVIGTWAFDPSSRAVNVSLLGQVTRTQHRTITDHAAALTTILRRGWSPSTPLSP